MQVFKISESQQLSTLQNNDYQIPPGSIPGSSSPEFEEAIRMGGTLITVPGPNAQYGVLAGKARYICTWMGTSYPGPMWNMAIRPVLPPIPETPMAPEPYRRVDMNLGEGQLTDPGGSGFPKKPSFVEMATAPIYSSNVPT